MRPPNSISALCAMTFGLLGAAFVVIGTLYGCLGVSIRWAASSWAFLPIRGGVPAHRSGVRSGSPAAAQAGGAASVCRNCRARHHRSGAPS